MISSLAPGFNQEEETTCFVSLLTIRSILFSLQGFFFFWAGVPNGTHLSFKNIEISHLNDRTNLGLSK